MSHFAHLRIYCEPFLRATGSEWSVLQLSVNIFLSSEEEALRIVVVNFVVLKGCNLEECNRYGLIPTVTANIY
jgi:hypothetical protein